MVKPHVALAAARKRQLRQLQRSKQQVTLTRMLSADLDPPPTCVPNCCYCSSDCIHNFAYTKFTSTHAVCAYICVVMCEQFRNAATDGVTVWGPIVSHAVVPKAVVGEVVQALAVVSVVILVAVPCYVGLCAAACTGQKCSC